MKREQADPRAIAISQRHYSAQHKELPNENKGDHMTPRDLEILEQLEAHYRERFWGDPVFHAKVHAAEEILEETTPGNDTNSPAKHLQRRRRIRRQAFFIVAMLVSMEEGGQFADLRLPKE